MHEVDAQFDYYVVVYLEARADQIAPGPDRGSAAPTLMITATTHGVVEMPRMKLAMTLVMPRLVRMNENSVAVPMMKTTLAAVSGGVFQCLDNRAQAHRPAHQAMIDERVDQRWPMSGTSRRSHEDCAIQGQRDEGDELSPIRAARRLPRRQRDAAR